MRVERPADNFSDRLGYLLLPLAALLAILPLILHGCSCGHDIGFHLESWLDAAAQLRHGTLYPAWAVSPAYNAGEPRFLFYPPLSWMLGGFLSFLVPFAAAPALYTWCVLTAAGWSLYTAARRFDIAPPAAFVGAAIYLSNPYMLFTGFERTAYAELLAAVWLPWLLLGALRARPTIPAIAVPLALTWLTNAPAAVMASYTLAFIAAVRVAHAFRRRSAPGALARTYIAGAALGLTLPAFFLLPAIYEQRFVQISMALVPGLSVPANFLFAHTADAAHDTVNHQVSRIALALLALTIAAILIAWKRGTAEDRRPLFVFASLTSIIAVLQEPLSQSLWLHLPKLAFLQFPWRLLTVLAAVLGLSIAFAVARFRANPAATITATFAAVLALAFTLGHFYIAACAATETPAAIATQFRTSHGVAATDEYTPNNADNDILRSDDPGYWLADDPAAFAAGTLPNPNATAPDVDFGTPPPSQTLSQPAPHHFTVNIARQHFLILNLRDYPNWRVRARRSDGAVSSPPHYNRDDGLVALFLPAGTYELDIRWHTGMDRAWGFGISLIALYLLRLCILHSRRIVH